MLKPHKAYQLKRKLGMREAFKPGPERVPPKKHHIAVFFQLACGHALTGAYLERFKLRPTGACWWCKKQEKQTRSHLIFFFFFFIHYSFPDYVCGRMPRAFGS
jgi:hypothetical protein